MDFDYQQFIENRDWDITNLAPLLNALGTVPYGFTDTTTEKGGGNKWAQIIGLGMTVAGFVMGGPGGAAIGR